MNPLLYLPPPQVIKLGAATADVGGWACRAAVGAGAREWEVARAGVEAMYRHIRCSVGGSTPSHTQLSDCTVSSEEAGDRAELMDTWVWFQSGLNTDGAHNPLTSRRVQHGDILSLDCFPMIQGQYDVFTRPSIRYCKKKTT